MGTSNLAARRVAKANRRKTIVAEKRRAEAFGGTLAGQVATAAALPIRHCLLTENVLETGIGILTLARGRKVGSVVVGAFLLDPFCRGVKDVMIHTLEAERIEYYLDKLSEATPLEQVDPSYARKMLRDLVEWSRSLGFEPPRDFAAVERLFGSVDPQACETAFAFGHDGKPLYVSSPIEPRLLARRHIDRMRDQLGSDGFHYIVAT
jgi:hypothetical protein